MQSSLSGNPPFLNAALIAAGFVLAYASISFLFRSFVPHFALLSELIFPAANGLTACIWLRCAMRSEHRSRVRAAWTLLAAAQLFYTSGDVVWSVLDLYLSRSPSPSLADLLYLTAYPLFMAGILLFPVRPMSSSERQRLLIDTGIMVISASLIYWVFLIVPTITTSRDGTLAVALSLAYPVMDLLVLFVILTLLFRHLCSLDGRTLCLLFLGGVSEIFYDFAYSVTVLHGSYTPGDPIDILGISGYVLFILAGISYLSAATPGPSGTQAGSEPLSSQMRWLSYAPYISAGTAYILIMWSHSNSKMSQFTFLMELGVGAVIGLAFIRQIISFNENSQLYAKAQREISERIRAEELLRASEHRLADIIDFLPDSTIVLDRDGKVIAWNRAIEVLTGIRAEDMLGKGNYEYSMPFYGRRRPILIDLVLRPDCEVEAEYSSLKRGDGALAGEAYVPMLGGGDVYILGIASALYDSQGDIVGAIESIKEITERKRSEEILKASLQEKEVLLREIHHRVKNNLQVVSSLLSLQGRGILDRDAAEAFKDSQNRIRSMALVHEKLYRSDDLSKVHINEYIRNLTEDLIRSFESEKKVRFLLSLDDVFLRIDKAVPFGLILNELITNCIKHAFPGDRAGVIRIILRLDGDILKLSVCDDGVGMPDGLDMDNPKSLGLIVVQALVKQLRGSLEFGGDGGTEVCITISI